MRKLGGGYFFTKIDLANAYNHIKLSPDSQKKLALSTHRGVLLQTRLPSLVEYLGHIHILSGKGISKGSKVDAVLKMPRPTNVAGLRSFLDAVLLHNSTANYLSQTCPQ